MPLPFAQISEQTSVSFTLSVCGALISAVIVATFRITNMINKLDRRFDSLERKYRASLRINVMRTWARELDRKNETLVVPDIDSVISDNSLHGEDSVPPY